MERRKGERRKGEAGLTVALGLLGAFDASGVLQLADDAVGPGDFFPELEIAY